VAAFVDKPVLVSYADVETMFARAQMRTRVQARFLQDLAALFSHEKYGQRRDFAPADLAKAVAAGEIGLVSGMYISRDALDSQTRLLLQRRRQQPDPQHAAKSAEYAPVTLKCIDALPVDYAFMRLLERWDDNSDPGVAQIKTKAFFRVVSWPNDDAEKDLVCVVPRNRTADNKPRGFSAGGDGDENGGGGGGNRDANDAACAGTGRRGRSRAVLTYVSEGGFINRASLRQPTAKSGPPSVVDSWLYLPTFADVVAFLQDPDGCIKREETTEIPDADMKALLFALYKGNFYVAQHVEIDADVADDEQELISGAPVDTLMRACELLTAECKSAISSDIAAGPAQGEAAFDSFVGKANDMLATTL
jgi:hypothetical protein